jgi:nicotinate phosphoribosyltransferase
MEKNGKFHPAMKLSQGKITLPARKQIHRVTDERGNFVKDIIALHDEDIEGEPLLIKVMENGKMTYDLPTIDEIRKNASKNLSKLPEKHKRLKRASRYTVHLSPRLKRLVNTLTEELKKIELGSRA